MENWAELPFDLIAQIAKHVKVIEEFIVFGAVCTSWKIATTKENFNVLSPQLPLLMLEDKDDDYREFYSLSKRKFHAFFSQKLEGDIGFRQKDGCVPWNRILER
ncbi:putative DNA topoisomerase 6 subunit A-like [Capsicum annuum]|nr:putative DNA topoisomerase 6 subunit A-like [Capsicum annuum]